jgi:hypothetical protein
MGIKKGGTDDKKIIMVDCSGADGCIDDARNCTGKNV